MPELHKITLNLQTGDLEDAGTDGDVYLGVCGREFYVDSEDPDEDDFERNSTHEYVFGVDASNINPPANDPRNPQLFTENVERFPMYIRFQPRSRTDHWFLHRAEVSFNDSFFPRWDTLELIGRAGIWLGTRSGMYVHLPMHLDSEVKDA